MRIIILGAGLQGSACAYDLLRQDDVEALTLADLKPDETPGFLAEDPRLRRLPVDFADETAVGRALAGHDVALSAAPYHFNADLARLALEASCHFTDLGGNTRILREQLKLDEAAREAGVSLVPDVGLAPGLVDILAWEGIRRLDIPRSVRMFVGGLPQNPKPPLNYQLVYSLEGTLDYYTAPSWVVRDGRTVEVEALSEVEKLEFEGVERLEAFHTGGGASLLPWELEGRVERLEYKTLRYPGHAATMRTLRELGLLSEKPIAVGSTELIPRQVFIACVTPLLTHEDPDVVVLRVLVEGERRAESVRLVWELLDRADPETGISAMGRTTGFSLAITGLFLGRGVIERRSVEPAYRATPYKAYVAELNRRGVRVRFSEAVAAPSA